jgi:hypothetical protein
MTQSASAVGAAGVPKVGGWDFDDLSGLILWSDNSAIVQSSGEVTAWPGLSAGNNWSVSGTPLYVASDARFPTPQPAVQFAANSYLSCATLASIAWLAIVAIYPGATFGDYATLFCAQPAGSGDFAFRGENGSASWRTSGNRAGTQYRNGAATGVALTTANVPHLYEFEPTAAWTPTTASLLGNDPLFLATRYWTGVVCLVLATTVVPNSTAKANVLARCQARGMLP